MTNRMKYSIAIILIVFSSVALIAPVLTVIAPLLPLTFWGPNAVGFKVSFGPGLLVFAMGGAAGLMGGFWLLSNARNAEKAI